MYKLPDNSLCGLRDYDTIYSSSCPMRTMEEADAA